MRNIDENKPAFRSPFPTLKEASEETGFPESALRRAIYSRRLAVVRTGSPRGRIRIAREDLDAFVRRCRVPALGERRIKVAA
jgi:excisionase family DNA binding protein